WSRLPPFNLRFAIFNLQFAMPFLSPDPWPLAPHPSPLLWFANPRLLSIMSALYFPNRPQREEYECPRVMPFCRVSPHNCSAVRIRVDAHNRRSLPCPPESKLTSRPRGHLPW